MLMGTRRTKYLKALKTAKPTFQVKRAKARKSQTRARASHQTPNILNELFFLILVCNFGRLPLEIEQMIVAKGLLVSKLGLQASIGHKYTTLKI